MQSAFASLIGTFLRVLLHPHYRHQLIYVFLTKATEETEVVMSVLCDSVSIGM